MKFDNTKTIKNQMGLLNVSMFMNILMGGFGYISMLLFFEDSVISHLYLSWLITITVTNIILFDKLKATNRAKWLLLHMCSHGVSLITNFAPFFVIGLAGGFTVSQDTGVLLCLSTGLLYLVLFLRSSLPKKFWESNLNICRKNSKKRFDFEQMVLRVYKADRNVRIWSDSWNYLIGIGVWPCIVVAVLVRRTDFSLDSKYLIILLAGFLAYYVLYKFLAVYVIYPFIKIIRWEKEQGTQMFFIDD